MFFIVRLHLQIVLYLLRAYIYSLFQFYILLDNDRCTVETSSFTVNFYRHLHIFQTSISPEPMQIFANGKRHFYSFIEFYVIRLKIQGVKIGS